MSYEEYLEIAVASRLVEWVDGEVILYIPPATKHQDLSRFLSTLLDTFIRFFDLGVLHSAPLEVKLWPDGPSQELDIFFVAKSGLSSSAGDTKALISLFVPPKISSYTKSRHSATPPPI